MMSPRSYLYGRSKKNMLLYWRVISWMILRWHRKGLVFQSRLRQQASSELLHRAKSSSSEVPCSPSTIFFSCMSWACNCNSCTWILEKSCSLSGQIIGPTCRALLLCQLSELYPSWMPKNAQIYAELTTESCWIFRSLIVHVPAFIWAILMIFNAISTVFLKSHFIRWKANHSNLDIPKSII